MSVPVAGQRTGQRPMRAAVAAQRALGRMAADQSNVSSVLIVNIGGDWFRQFVDDDGKECRESVPAPGF